MCLTELNHLSNELFILATFSTQSAFVDYKYDAERTSALSGSLRATLDYCLHGSRLDGLQTRPAAIHAAGKSCVLKC